MTLRVVGAGLGRTGTMSLKLALEKLLGGPCYHMLEVFPRPDHVAVWHAAIRDEPVDWDALFDGFVAALDWPAAAFWRELSVAYPNAPVLLSTRDTDSWWTSCDHTIFEVFRQAQTEPNPWFDMVSDLFRERFAGDIFEPTDAKATFEKHNEEVRSSIDPARLIEWRTGDGWDAICRGLGVEVPDEPFPHTNTAAEFRSRAGWDA